MIALCYFSGPIYSSLSIPYNMNTTLRSISEYTSSDALIVLVKKTNLPFAKTVLSDTEYKTLEQATQQGIKQLVYPQAKRFVFIEIISNSTQEAARRLAAKIVPLLRNYRLKQITLIDQTKDHLLRSYTEGLVLANYQFLKYFKNKEALQSSLQTIQLLSAAIAPEQVKLLGHVLEGVCIARDLVNEPLSYLTAPQLAEEIKQLGALANFSVKVLDKAAIEKLNMGGILAVNKGSVDPPTFSILEWSPANPINKKPIVLVGKGVVYDTGGLSLKPTANSMDFMKSDMAGAAGIIGTMYAVAKSELPIHVVSLIPATDNRPGLNAYAPGDVIKMFNGSTVEVLNTDAEGRMLLADALHYAKQYDPELVIDMATLTGSAAHAIGNQAGVFMGTAQSSTKQALLEAGFATYERLVEFPLWEEYAEMLKSEIADIKNLGGSGAGAITAGKFLEHFVAYDWIHIDIAGVAFLHHEDAYRVKGGTGYGVQLLYNFLSNYSKP
ncbi:leucyl aminopeptidase family protein [Aureispira anguillae]|uniref:Leucyl aminopeptidase n=1 Tax=Aureispira anguillae TaxID=2864201 RepID=A0A915YLQ3_9BACT|nr:leucyl aminopeptidase [Aureispira anguillae]BDS15428.1 leucyl aminopeptidase [Aureispira anguillae]